MHVLALPPDQPPPARLDLRIDDWGFHLNMASGKFAVYRANQPDLAHVVVTWRTCAGQILVPPSRSPRVTVVEPTYARERDHPATARRLDGARDRRVATKRHMRSVLVVIGDIRAEQAQQMPLAKHDDVTE